MSISKQEAVKQKIRVLIKDNVTNEVVKSINTEGDLNKPLSIFLNLGLDKEVIDQESLTDRYFYDNYRVACVLRNKTDLTSIVMELI